MRRTPIILLLALGLALFAVACSADDEPSAGETTSSDGGFAVGQSAAYDGDDMAAEEEAPRSSVTGGDGALPPSEPGVASADILGRTIIRNASMQLEVESVTEAFDRVDAVAREHGGFVSDSSFFNGNDEDEQYARITLRVPAERYAATLDALRGIAVEVTSVQTSTQDVTEEVTDIASELRNLRAVEAQLLELLDEANGVGEIFQVQDRLNQVRSQIERLEGRQNLLESLADLATISVELRTPAAPLVEEPGGTTGPLEAAADAWEASLDALRTIATVGVVAVVFSWWLIPLLLVGAWAARRWRVGERIAAQRRVDPPSANI